MDINLFTKFPPKMKRLVSNAVPRMAYIVRVSDADTLVVLLDRLFFDSSVKRLRIKGIDSPELKTAAGKRAARFVTELLPDGTPVIVTTYKLTYDRYESDVRFWHKGKITNLADVIVEAGHAVRVGK
jgi:endonuclease YncB( thermonuclease family)